MARGIYGQAEGNERRADAVQFSDHLIANDLVEGEFVARLRRLVAAKDWKAVTRVTDELRRAGHSKGRVDSMLSRSMAGLRF